MDHQEQHHQKHRKERDEKKHHHQGGPPRGFHPTWYVVIAVGVILAAVLVWTFVVPMIVPQN